ncbi:zinc-ribbon domain-containing protein [[Eubacterium] cellulosolvens]
MKGAIVFVVFFLIMTVLTLTYHDLPPGIQIYEMLDVPETEQPVGGIPATVLIISLFNGIIYGIIAWLVYSIAMAAKHRRNNLKIEAESTEQKKYCINCGAEIHESATYCEKCGASQ